jgi:hypothetical protein
LTPHGQATLIPFSEQLQNVTDRVRSTVYRRLAGALTKGRCADHRLETSKVETTTYDIAVGNVPFMKSKYTTAFEKTTISMIISSFVRWMP